MRVAHIELPIAAFAVLSGCCSLNAGIDTREEFVRQRTAQIGKVIDVSTVHSAALRIEALDERTTRHIIGTSASSCTFEYRVNSSSRVVESWHYISRPEGCTANRYYCGAW
jgi:hypothetical protein